MRPLANFPKGTIWANFGFTPAEVLRCELCNVSNKDTLRNNGSSLIACVLPATPHCPVTGMVGLCKGCLDRPWRQAFFGLEYRVSTFDLETLKYVSEAKKWHPPPMVQPLKGVPIYVLSRGFCDDQRLADVVGEAWQRIPAGARKPMLKHWAVEARAWCDWRDPDSWAPSLDSGALRIEALPSWPGFRCLYGQMLNDGHAIRLHSPTVQAMPDKVLMTLIAHELGHCYQYATLGERRWKIIEAEVHEIMAGWGFRDTDIDAWAAKRYRQLCRARDAKELSQAPKNRRSEATR